MFENTTIWFQRICSEMTLHQNLGGFIYENIGVTFDKVENKGFG